jgi:beta-glucosidase
MENGTDDRKMTSIGIGIHREVEVAFLLLTAFATTLPQIGLVAQAQTNQAVPYTLPVELPAPVSSPEVDPTAPYTPLVRSLIAQLEPSQPPTADQIRNAARFLYTQDGANRTCHNLANVVSAIKTTPSIMPLCFSDGLFISPLDGPNVGKSTGMSSLLLLGSSFDRKLANAMGQAEGREGRNLMVTGLLGPQADTDLFINWTRGHQTPGEDPFLNGEVTAAEVNGIQGQGLMAQVKHFTGHNGVALNHLIEFRDQALHEMILPPYEIGLQKGGASSIMCAYDIVRDMAQNLDYGIDDLTAPSPYLGAGLKTWPLNEAHYACENPFLQTYVLRDLWGFKGFVGSDYGAAHSTSAFLQGMTREDPSGQFLGITNPRGREAIDAGSSTCADSFGNPVTCTAPGAIHIAGIPGTGCPAKGCGLVEAVIHGLVPLSLFNQGLARVLYQEERFGLLGCDNGSTNCPNPGGIDGDRSGTAPLKDGPINGMPSLGTKDGDAAIVERVAEEGGVLLKNENHTLPINFDDLKGGIAVSGAGAEYLIANPNNEGSAGFTDRNAINPLQQLEALSGQPSAFTFTPTGAPTGSPVACNLLSSAPIQRRAPAAAPSAACDAKSGLQRLIGIAADRLKAGEVDRTLDFTAESPQGQLAGGEIYRWEGWLYVPRMDTYSFRIQHSVDVDDAKISFSVDGSEKTLRNAVSFYQGQYYGTKSVEVSLTNAGYTEKGLRNRQCSIPLKPLATAFPGASPDEGIPAPSGFPGFPPPAPAPIVRCTETPEVGWHKIALTIDATDLSREAKVSFRFAVSRKHGDIEDAAEAAKGKAMAIVFVNDQGRKVTSTFLVESDAEVSSLPAEQIELINAVAAVNPNTVVVLNTGTPIVLKEWINNPNVKALLNMWQTGQEGGTATARLLLGQANPSGHSPMTWPLNNHDTIEGYDQPHGLYDGDTAGRHPERLNGLPDGASRQTEGIYSGYRFYDQLQIPVQFPFGFGLSYTNFTFSNLKTMPNADGSLNAEFDVKNTGAVSGAEVAQVYVGPGPAMKGMQQAVRALRGFERVNLNPGETRHLSIQLDVRSFQCWSETAQKWVTNPGERSIYIGDADSIEHLPLVAKVQIASEN